MTGMEILLLREAAVVAACAAAAYMDHKTGFINDWITMPLVVLGAALNIYELEFAGLALGAIVFAFGYIMYYTGKLGGGDVKLYTGIALALPFYSGKIFIVSAALLAALFAVVFFGAFYVLRYFRKGVDLGYNAAGIRRACMLAAVSAAYFFLLYNSHIVSAAYVAALGIPMFFGMAFLALERGIRKEFFVKRIMVSEMEEDELIALDFMDDEERKKIGKMGKWVFGEKDREAMRKNGVTKIAVYRDLPRFGPFIFIGVVISLAVPEIGTLLAGGI